MRRWFVLNAASCISMIVAAQQVRAQPAPKTSQTTEAVDPASLALARQILAAEFPPKDRAQRYASRMRSILDMSLSTSDKLLAAKDKNFAALVDRNTRRMFDQITAIMSASLPDYYESLARAYARQFSQADLREILAFVETPAGTHYFERWPLVVKDPDVQAAEKRMMSLVMDKAPEISSENRKDIEDYVAKAAKTDTDRSMSKGKQ